MLDFWYVTDKTDHDFSLRLLAIKNEYQKTKPMKIKKPRLNKEKNNTYFGILFYTFSIYIFQFTAEFWVSKTETRMEAH